METTKRNAYYKLAKQLEATRGRAELVNGGHLHLGKTVLDHERVDIEADVEIQNGNYRFSLFEAGEIIYTTRVESDGLCWMFADKKAALETRNHKIVTLYKTADKKPCIRQFDTVFDIVRWTFQIYYNKDVVNFPPRKVAIAETPHEPLWEATSP